MNANDLLIEDHRTVEDTYDQFREAEGEERTELGKQILTDLTVHAAVEEEHYYPELERNGEQALANEYRAEHEGVKAYIARLSMMSADDEEYEPTMKAMMESVTRHVAEEEATAMPKMAEIIGEERLMEMGREIEERREELRDSAIKRLFATIT